MTALRFFLCIGLASISGCTSAEAEPCERLCSVGYSCERVPSTTVAGTFREECVSTAACSPACQDGESCQGGECVSLCDPECAAYEVCQDEACAFPSYGLGCSQVLACLADCPSGDTSCAKGCEEAGNAIGGNLYGVYRRCLDDNGCTDSACAETFCLNEQRGCLGLPPLCSPACPTGFRCSATAECVPNTSAVCEPPCLAGQSCVDGVCRLGSDCSSGDSTTCIGNILQRCQNGASVSVDCNEVGPQCACALIQGENRSDCVCNGQGSMCNPPCPAPTQCINGSCE